MVTSDGLSYWALQTVVAAVSLAIAIIIIIIVVVVVVVVFLVVNNGRHKLGMFRDQVLLLPPPHLAQLLVRIQATKVLNPAFECDHFDKQLLKSSHRDLDAIAVHAGMQALELSLPGRLLPSAR